MSQFTIGIDFGTLSARAVLIRAEDGKQMASAECEYPHGVICEQLPDGTPLPSDYALQYPQDYLDALKGTISGIMRESGIQPDKIAGIGLDCTACTAMPVDQEGTPLCMKREWEKNPHAYVKLWKHHAAQRYADRMTQIARERNEPWFNHYGGRVSGEWALPKLWQILDEAPELYDAMYEWVEAGDWVVWQLTGKNSRNICAAGYKYFYSKRDGYPSDDFYAALDPRLSGVNREKCIGLMTEQGSPAGELTEKAAAWLGLEPGLPVATANVDAHVCIPAAGITGAGQMLAIIGTSTCHMLLSKEMKSVPGVGGAVEDGILPGFVGYEAGQSCVGDQFAWFCEHCVPAEYDKEAKLQNMSIHQYLTRLAEKKRPGESGLMALDWWNGNRSTLADFDLTGLLAGMTLKTRAEDIYRALIESTAYGTRMIVENFRQYGVPVDSFYATGGISVKNAMAMQIYADVLNMQVNICGTAQGGALGSAIFAAVAAGIYDSIENATRAMAPAVQKIYYPAPDSVTIYNRLYRIYAELYDTFGRKNGLMKELKKLRNDKEPKP